MEAVSSESQFNINKHWICRINLVFIHRTNNNNNNNISNNNGNNNNTNDDKNKIGVKSATKLLFKKTNKQVI